MQYHISQSSNATARTPNARAASDVPPARLYPYHTAVATHRGGGGGKWVLAAGVERIERDVVLVEAVEECPRTGETGDGWEVGADLTTMDISK